MSNSGWAWGPRRAGKQAVLQDSISGNQADKEGEEEERECGEGCGPVLREHGRR